MPASIRLSLSRRRFLQSAGAGLGALALPQLADADGITLAGARLSADFDPVAAIWLGYDPGHEAFTAELAQALWPHVPIKMLVRDAEAQAKAMVLLRARGLDAARVAFVQDGRAPFSCVTARSMAAA